MASTDMLKTVLNAFKVRFNTLTGKISKLENDLKINTVQGNWNQNNSKDPEYIKNRPFYDDTSGKSVKIPERFIPIANSDSIGGVKANPNLKSDAIYSDVMIDENGNAKYLPSIDTETYNKVVTTYKDWHNIYKLVVNNHIIVVTKLYVNGLSSTLPSTVRIFDMSISQSKIGSNIKKFVYHGYGVAVGRNTSPLAVNEPSLIYFKIIWNGDPSVITDSEQIAQRVTVPLYGSFTSLNTTYDGCYLRVNGDALEWNKDITVPSTTSGSTKKFKINVDDTGSPAFTDTSDSTNSWTPYSPPTVTSSDAGKFLRVSSTGEWAAEAVPNAADKESVDALKSDLTNLSEAVADVTTEKVEKDVITTRLDGFINTTSGKVVISVNTGANTHYVLQADVTSGEEYRVVCSYLKSTYGVGYAFTSDDNTVIEQYYDENVTVWQHNKTFDVIVPDNATKLYVHAFSASYTASIKRLTTEQNYSSKSYSKEETYSKNEVDDNFSLKRKIFEKGAVLFSFDAMNLTDGRLDIMNEYGYRATAQTGNPTQTISQNKLDVIKGLRKAGWEIATYTSLNFPVDTYGRDVACADEPTQEVIDAWDFYVSESIKGENAHGVFFPIVWNCRQGLFCTGLKMALEKYGYKMARGDYPIYAKRVECFGENYSFNVGSLGMYVDKVAETKARIDRAVNEKCGMVIFSHGLYSTDEDALANYGTTEPVMREVLDYVKSYIDQGKLDVLTYHELYARYFPKECSERDYMRTMASIGYLSD